MKKIALSAALLFSLLLAAAQKKTKPEEAFYLLDEKMNSTTVEKAKYLVHSTKKMTPAGYLIPTICTGL